MSKYDGLTRDQLITELEKAESALTDFREKYNFLFDCGGAGIGIWSEDGRLIDFNRKALLYIGVDSVDEIAGKSLQDIFGDEYGNKYYSRIKQAVDSNDILEFEDSVSLPEGDRYFLSTYMAVKDSAGAVKYIQIISKDITSQKRAEEQLKQTRALLDYAEKLTLVGGWEWDITKDEYTFSKGWMRVHGVDNSHLNRDQLFKIVPPGDHEKIKTCMEDALSGKKDYEIKHRIIKQDTGEERIVQAYGAVIRDENGNPVKMFGASQDITSFENTRNALIKNEGKYRAVFEQSPNSILLIDGATGRILDFNDKAHKTLGYTREEFSNITIPEIEAIESADEVEAHIAQVTESGGQSFESKHRTKDGRILDVMVTTRVFKLEGREIFSSVWSDITSLKEAQRKLTQSEERFRNLFVSSIDWIWEVDINGRYTSVSDNVEQIIGYTPEEVIGKTPFDFMAPEEASRVGRVFGQIIARQGRIEKLRDTMLRKDGNPIIFETNGIPLYDDNCELMGYFGICRDVTVQVHAEEAIKDSEEKYRTVVESATDGIAIIQDGVYKYVNPMIEKFSGWTPEDLIDRSFNEFMPSEESARVFDFYQKRVRGDEAPERYETVIYHKNGRELPVEVSVARIKYHGEMALIAFIRDISDRKKAESALLESEAKLSAIFNSTKQAFMLLDTDGKFLAFNTIAVKWAEKIFGRPIEMGSRLIEYMPAEHLDGFKTNFARAMNGDLVSVDKYVEGKDSEILWLNFNYYPVHSHYGNVNGVCLNIIDITNTKLAENALKKNEELLNQAEKLAGAGSFVWDIRDDSLKWSKNMYALFGIEDPDAVENLSDAMQDFIHPDDRARVKNDIVKMIKERKNTEMEFRIIRADGEIRVQHCIGRFVFDERGVPIQCVGVHHDITEQKKAERELMRSEEKYRTVIEMATDAIFVADPDSGILLDTNRRAEELMGMSRDEMIGQHQSILHPPEELESYKNKFCEAVSDKGRKFMQVYVVHKDGRHIPVEISSGGRIKMSDRDIHVGIFRDITERKQAEDALRESEGKYRSLVESLNLGIALINPDMRVVSVNGVIRKWYPETDFSKNPVCYQAFKGAQGNCENCPIISTFKDGNSHEKIFEITSAGEVKSFRVMASPVSDDNGKTISVIKTVEDVTERLRTEKELQKQEKLESVGILAGGIAHDFNNILTSIIGNLSLVKYDEIDEETNELINDAEKAAERARDLTQQLLTFSKGGAPVKNLASLSNIIKESAKFTLSGSNVRCDFNIPDDLRFAEVDEGQISQVINNLVLNADQAMPGGGIIKISADNVKLAEGNELQMPPGNYVKIEIEDEGTGIPEKYIGRIFDPYFTTKEKGNGLGLAGCYSIINKHGGHIGVESKLGVGARFTIYLPASHRKRDLISICGHNSLSSGEGRILVMDDEEQVRKLTSNVLSRIGYDVEFAKDGEEAIEKYKNALTSGKPFDAVILDLTIPGGMGGKEAIAKLRELDPDIKAIVSSGYSNDLIMAEYKEYGFSGRILKPYKAKSLAEELSEIMRDETKKDNNADNPLPVRNL
ncbi:MAG: PAS domain S-box protein [candidate division Zixibacteria bacterium]|nr:PAS domain S-box protein [candidate division Zixibacteria bacterium]